MNGLVVVALLALATALGLVAVDAWVKDYRERRELRSLRGFARRQRALRRMAR